jgi:DNA polymerase I-like protein with 3'-5' exonuclease and polymerase domains
VASKATGILSRASYRWRSDEQRTRQSCAGNPSGAQNYSFTASSGQQIVTVEEINFAGCFLVYDITVEEDESYSACGIYSHNSSTPNLQNIPSRSKLGKKVRECFVPDVGHIKWRKFDFSQIHYRLLAHYAVDRGDGSAEALRERYRNDKTTDYHMDVYRNVAPLMGWSLTDEEEIKLKRRPIKNVNFGLLYGQSEKSLAYKSGMSEAQAKDFFKSYHAGAPYVKATMEEIGKEVQQYGYVTTLLGRRIRFNYWEPIRRDFDNPEMPLPYELAIRKWGAGIRRAYEYRGVNYKFQGSEPDIMKSAMRACWQSGVYDVTGVPSITVHDETDHSVIDDTPRMREAYDFIKHTMENTIKLRIPIFADENNGPNWGKSD